MDASRFDMMSRLVGGDGSRRDLLKAAGAAALGVFGFTSLLGADEAKAKKNKKKRRRRRRRRCKPNAPGSACLVTKDCCPKKTKHICATSHGTGSNTCCGSLGAACSSDLTCCIENACEEGHCVATP